MANTIDGPARNGFIRHKYVALYIYVYLYA